MQALKVVFILLEVLLLFNLLIFVHELGHFLAARWRGLVVERFGIWFGKPLWQKTINGVVYCLGSIPAGGYVALPQMASMEVIEGKSEQPQQKLPPISAVDKIIVAVAGPVFSFGLALVFAVIVWAIGRPVSDTETTTTIGYVVKDSPAEKVGLQPGDKILEVDGKPVSRFGGIGDSVTWRIVRSEGENIPIKVERDGKIQEFKPVPVKDPTASWERKSLRQIKIWPLDAAIIDKVAPNSPADLAGLKHNDRIVAVNGQKLYHFLMVTDVIQKNPNEKVALKILRDQKEFEVSLKPEVPERIAEAPAPKRKKSNQKSEQVEEDKGPKLGISWNLTGDLSLVHPGPIEQIKLSVNSMISTFGAIFSSKSDIKPQHLSGPVKIMQIYYVLFESDQGWRQALWFSVILNVNLALLNMLPIPVLDGGHIVLALVEWFRRKPANVKIVNIIQSFCAVVIIFYMLYVTFYDVQDLPWNRSKAREPQVRFKAPVAPETR